MLERAYSAIICPLYALPRSHIARLGRFSCSVATPHLLCVCLLVQVRTCMTVLQLCSLPQESYKAAAAQSYRPLGAKACISTARRPGTGRRPEPTGSPSTAIPVRTICCSRGHIVGPLYALFRAYNHTWGVAGGTGQKHYMALVSI